MLQINKIENLTGHSMVLNEEKYIRQVIRSTTPYLQRHIIADTGSTDRTIEYLEEAQKQYPQIEIWKYPLQKDCSKWDGNHLSAHLTKIRNDMIKSTTTGWCWQIDGDECPDDLCIIEISKSIEQIDKLNLKEIEGLYLKIKWCVNNEQYIEPGPFPHTLRLFRPNGVWQNSFPDEFYFVKNKPITIYDNRCRLLNASFLHMSLFLHKDRRPQNGYVFELSDKEKNILKHE